MYRILNGSIICEWNTYFRLLTMTDYGQGLLIVVCCLLKTAFIVV